MKKRWIVGVLVIIVLILIVGWTLLTSYMNRPPTYVTYGNKAVETNNASVCLELDDMPHTYPMDCWKYMASQRKNIDVCNQIDIHIERFNCYTGFIYIKEDLNECDLLSGEEKGFCIRVLAGIKNDAQLCDLISDSGEKEACEVDLFLQSVDENTYCADSDGGIVEETKGVVFDRIDNAVYSDQCLGTDLIEHYCENSRHKEKVIACGCSNDVCA